MLTAAEGVPQVRSFNRMVTERIGALQDAYLSRGRSLGASRLLWEIGDGTELRVLRGRLGLDSGYLSRLLAALEAEGLVEVGRSPEDGRVRVATVTAQGRQERALLDRESDVLAWSLLDPLSPRQRERLVVAMAEVERLMTASAVTLDVVDPSTADARHCLHEYYSELNERFDAGYDPAQGLPVDDDDMRPPRGLLVLASLRGDAVGCCVLRFLVDGVVELNRMWVDPAVRGLGVGRRLLADLERRAGGAGATALRLETNRALTEAIAMYRAAGFVEVEPFNDEPYATHWFEKRLDEGA
jgi:DNA-binding MarR family transcriptional regulator/GNAT superfamily N-acetyltransferase